MALEFLTSNGMESVGEAVQILINKAMQLDRSEFWTPVLMNAVPTPAALPTDFGTIVSRANSVSLSSKCPACEASKTAMMVFTSLHWSAVCAAKRPSSSLSP